MSEWISVEDQLPENKDGYVWTFRRGHSFAHLKTWHEVLMHRHNFDYWMPTNLVKPEPPQ